MAGGAFVVLFSVVAQVLKPKRFAGLFGAAPSVATASLLVTAASKGTQQAQPNALGMMAGAVALGIYCVAAVWLVNRFRGVAGSALAIGAWLTVAGGLYLVFLR
jgi:uncharacterized membrane protein (GlpM family)